MEKTKPTGRDSDKFMLRLPDGMRDRIAEEAKKNNRSMNSEIIARLEQTLGPVKTINPDDKSGLIIQQLILPPEMQEIHDAISKLYSLHTQYLFDFAERNTVKQKDND